MFERVVTMASYVRSCCFSAPTIFLDIDAFLIRPVFVDFLEVILMLVSHIDI